VSTKMSLEVVPRDGVDVRMGVAVRLHKSAAVHRVCAQQKGLSRDPCIGRSRDSSQLP
jgi:hypothetical protein